MISVIIPMYNVETLIKRTIKSVLDQGINECEIIIIDDCSTDNSYSVCKEFIESENIKNIMLLKNKKNMGPSYTRNRGIKTAKGKYVIFLDSDDYYVFRDDTENARQYEKGYTCNYRNKIPLWIQKRRKGIIIHEQRRG